MKTIHSLVCVLVIGVVPHLSAAPQEEPELKKLRTLKAEPLAVVQVGSEVQIVKKSEVPALKKELDTKYRSAVKEYLQARAEARKAKRKFDDPRPSRETLSILAASVKTQEDAEKVREKAMNEFLVVKSQDALKVIRKLEFASFKAKAESDYRTALAQYNEARKASRREKQAFKQPAPAKPAIKVLASRLNSEEAALEKMASLEKKGSKSRAKAKSKVKGKDTTGKGPKDKDEESEDDVREDEEPERLE